MNGKRYGMSRVQDGVEKQFMPGRAICTSPHSEGLEKLDGRYVFGFVVPSKETKNRVYHLTYDPVTGEIFHQCTATQTQYCSLAGMARYGPHTPARKFHQLCRHAKVVKRWVARNKAALAHCVDVLTEIYERDASVSRTG